MTQRRLHEHHTPRFELESGEVLTNLVQSYHLDGRLNSRRDNLVLVFHALTGSADAVGDWWRTLARPGGVLSTESHAVLCVNLLGSCYGTRWDRASGSLPPAITPRDMANAIRRVVDRLEVSGVALAVGASLGGMVALEWALCFPGLTRRTVSIAAPAAHTASAIAWNGIQREAIALGGERGLALARQVAMMTYRTGIELEERFARNRQDTSYEVERYLRHHGQKLVGRFDVDSYVSLLNTMDSHDVGRGRGGIASALRGAGEALVGVGIPGDILYPVETVAHWTSLANAEYREIHSIHGHDAFLLEEEQVNSILNGTLAQASVPTCT